VEYLLSRGASVHYQASIAEGFQRGWSALAFAAGSGDTEAVMILLSNGADVLQEFMHRGMKVTASQLADRLNPDLARALVHIECEERAKRVIPQGSPPPDILVPCSIG